MTQEEKAKAYDKAIKRVEDIETGKCPKPFMFTEGLFDYIFPELKESEDEKIRKELLEHCINRRDGKQVCVDANDYRRWADWLEKQGEQKETLCDKCKKTQPSHSCQDITALGRCALEKQGEQKLQGKLEDDVRRRSTIQVLEYARSLDTYNQYGKADIDKNIAWLEKQSEQKPKGKTTLEAINEEKVDNANKVEPQDELTKFEKAVKQVMEEAIECGDTHNLKADAEMLLNLIQKPDEEYNITGIHSKHAEGKLGEMIKNLKTINEKQGEKTRYSIGDVLCDKSCTTLNKDAQPNFEIVAIKDGAYICDKGYIPISQQDEYELVAKKIEQKSSWSEEDEAMWTEISDLLWEGYKQSGSKFSWDDIRNWVNSKLKSLRPQSTWKPSDEQIKAQKGKEV